MYNELIKRRLIINAFPGCEYVAWAALLGAMRAHPEKRRQVVRTPEGHGFIVKHNVHTCDAPGRCRSWSITQVQEGKQ